MTAAVEKRLKPGYKSPFSPYANGYAYCPLCARFYHLSEVPTTRKGWPLCPYHRVTLRKRFPRGERR